jgi:hypothetical protein
MHNTSFRGGYDINGAVVNLVLHVLQNMKKINFIILLQELFSKQSDGRGEGGKLLLRTSEICLMRVTVG